MFIKKIKIIILWLMCPVCVGLIPAVLRFVVSHTLQEGSLENFSNFDFISFGLILSIHTLTQRKFFHDPEKIWDQLHLLATVFLIIFYSVFCIMCLMNQVNKNQFNASTITIFCLSFNGGSLLIGLITCIVTVKNER